MNCKLKTSRHRTTFLYPVYFLLILGLAASTCSLLAQEVTATITGTVTDPNGAPISGAAITATDTERGSSFQAKTNNTGDYNLVNIPIGTYRVEAKAQGFSGQVQGPFTLVLNQTARLLFHMKIGDVSQTVKVTAIRPLLQTDSTEMSTLLDSGTIAALPLTSRNYVELTLLVPGATSPNPTSVRDAQRIDGAGQPYINGNRQRANNYLLDGMDNNQLSLNGIAFTPSPDAIQEFNLITQNAPAEFGNFQGGIISVSIKSGTNKFHGAAWEFFRNSALNANNWGNKLLNAEAGGVDVAPRPPLHWNMFGGTVGGPIFKNKLFFFVDYQGQRFETNSTSSFNAFTASERQGDFSQLCTDPSVGGSFNGGGICTGGTQLSDPFTAAPIPFNNLGAYIAGNFDPTLTAYYNSGAGKVAQNLFASSLYPSISSLINQNLQSNYTYKTVTPLNVDQGDIKLDFNLSQKDHIFGRYSEEHQRNYPTQSLAIANLPTQGFATIRNGVVDWTHSNGSNILNDLRVGYNWTSLFALNYSSAAAGNLGSAIGIANGNAAGPGLSGLTFTTASSVGGSGSGASIISIESVIQAEDHVNITHGRHNMNIGFQFYRERLNDFYAGNTGRLGTFSFGGNFTGSGDSDFYLGMVNSEDATFAGVNGGSGQPKWDQRSNIFAPYAQDDWHATDHLTLNLGIRYQAHTPWTDAKGQEVNYDINSGQPFYPAGSPLPTTVIFPGLQPKADNNKALYQGYYGPADLEPRIGFAYTPPGLNGRTVIRAAYTISDFLEGTGNALRPTLNLPFNLFISKTNYCAGGQPGCDPTLLQVRNGIIPNGAQPFAGANLNIWDQHFRPSIAQQWNLSIQQQLNDSTTAQIAYVGQHGTHLAIPKDFAQGVLEPDGTVSFNGPYLTGNPDLISQIGFVSASFTSASSEYSALQAQVQKRLSAGLEGQISYTWSHCFTDDIGFFGDGGQAGNASSYWQNAYSNKGEWGGCYFDVQHDLTISGVYSIPFGRGRKYGNQMNRVVGSIISDWAISAIYTFRGGFPLTVPANDYSGTNSPGSRADCNARPQYLKKHIFNGIQWVSPNSYSSPNVGTFGSCSVSTLRGPGEDNIDLSLQRQFPIAGSQILEFRAEALNSLNHPLFNSPNTFCGGSPGAPCDPGFGQISSTQGERNIQVALKYYF